MKLADLGAALIVGFIGLVISFVVGVGCYGFSNVKSADGYRDSTVRKFSKTGVIWETWEAETLGDGLVRDANGKLSPETFKYSVRPERTDLIEKLKTIPGEKKVRIHYQKQLTTWTPRGESNYFITQIEDLK